MVLNVKFDAFFWREERWNIEFDAFFWREERCMGRCSGVRPACSRGRGSWFMVRKIMGELIFGEYVRSFRTMSTLEHIAYSPT